MDSSMNGSAGHSGEHSEERVNSEIGRLFPYVPVKPADQLHPIVLAYIGDAVYELNIRHYLLSKSNHRPDHLHKTATRYVSAHAQSAALEHLMPLLSEKEADIVKKGRNAKSGSAPKRADILTYRHSTAFECLLGYLYCAGQFERLRELMQSAVAAIESEKSS